LIEERYGWTDSEIAHGVPYARFIQISRVASEQKAEDLKVRMKEQAFLGWLFYKMQPLKKGYEHMNYKDWLINLGLSDKDLEENVEKLKEKALKIADDIIKMDKKHRR